MRAQTLKLYSLGACLWVLALLVPTLVSAQVGSKVYRQNLKEVRSLIGYEEYGPAIPVLQKLLKDDPDNPLLNYWMGKSLFMTYKKIRALSYLEKTARSNPGVADDFYFFYGLALHHNEKYDDAIVQYRIDLERYAPSSEEYREVNNRISQCIYAKNHLGDAANSNIIIENLGPRINTPYSEHSPVISADNDVLIFTARRPDSKGADPEAGFYDEDIYISYKKEGEWTKSRNIDEPVNSNGHDATISLSADAKTLYLYRHKRQGGLYVTNFDSRGKRWTEPRAIERPLNSRYYEASICQSADSTRMFFTSDRPGGFGGLDIYMIEKRGNSWTDPVNLGPKINTPFNEDAPYLHPDGVSLYYSSNGPHSYGGYDVFVARFDTVQQAWQSGVNMGPPINTPDDEIYFVLSRDGTNGYYASGKEGGEGEKDIYNARFPTLNPEPVLVMLKATASDALTQDTLNAEISLKETRTGKLVFPVDSELKTGVYAFVLEPERSYSIAASSEGYLPGRVSLTSPSVAGEDIVIYENIPLGKAEGEKKLDMASSVSEETEPAKEEKPVLNMPELQHLYFDFDEDVLRGPSSAELKNVVQILKQDPQLSVQLNGHTDWYGNYDYNVALSKRRTNQAARYLRQHGIDAGRIKTDWNSENKPIASNDNDEGRQYNRRVEIAILDGNQKAILVSTRMKTGSEVPFVDRTTPRGEPGYDMPSGLLLDQDVAGETSSPSSPGKLDVRNGDEGKLDLSQGDKLEVGHDAGSETEEASGSEMPDLLVESLYFDFDKSGLRFQSKSELDKIADWLLAHPGHDILILGNTDAFGSSEYNQRLSESRCEAAFNYLRQVGVPADRMSYTGLSESKPIADNETAQGRQSNRRVDIVVRHDGREIMRTRH